MSTSSDNNAENQPSTSQAAFFPLLFGNPGNKPAFNDVDTEQLIASFSKLETNLNNNGPEQSTSKRAQSTEPLTTNLPNNGEKDKEQRPIIQLKRSRFNKTPNSPQQQQKHQSPQQQQQQQSSQQQTQEPKSPEQQQYQSPQQQHQSPEQQPQQAERQHNLSIHTLPSFNVAPKEPSPTTENSQPDNLTIQEKLATCFIFTPQDHDPSHSLATIFYQLETIRPSTEWHQITILCLGRQNLMQLDHLDEHFPLLEQLDVSHNELKTLSNLPNSLINLYASDNKLTYLEISNLDKLQHLDITHNKITTLDDISRLKSLRVIDASNNSIASCKYFVNLPGLTKLSLRNNALRRLTSFGSVQRPNQLETLDISFNRIECLDSIENLAELRNLNAEHNDIKYVQLTQPLERLCKLQLGFNRLKSFDVSSFPDIRTLYLDDNTIQRIIGVACIPRIESFSLRDQGGNKVEYNIQYLRGARKLYLSGSPFHNMERLVDFYSLEYLELCAANIEVLPVEFSKHVPNLSTLYLSLNRISDIRPLRKLKYLKRLVMIENRLVSVNEVIAVIQHLKQLTYLDLRQNPISTNIYPSVNINLIEGDKISPYVSSALDESWEKEDQIFCTGLSPQWLTRRKVYRALITQKCSKLVELDHIQISQQDRLDSDLIIDSYRKANSV